MFLGNLMKVQFQFHFLTRLIYDEYVPKLNKTSIISHLPLPNVIEICQVVSRTKHGWTNRWIYTSPLCASFAYCMGRTHK
jgi:hypothetical protein